MGVVTDQQVLVRSSLLSACLSLIGYMSFALILKTQSPDTPFVHLYLTVAFAFVGAATVGSYFASLTTGMLVLLRFKAISAERKIFGCRSFSIRSFSISP